MLGVRRVTVIYVRFFEVIDSIGGADSYGNSCYVKIFFFCVGMGYSRQFYSLEFLFGVRLRRQCIVYLIRFCLSFITMRLWVRFSLWFFSVSMEVWFGGKGSVFKVRLGFIIFSRVILNMLYSFLVQCFQSYEN